MDKVKITSFTKLETWQQSHKLVIAVFKIYDKLPNHDALRNQTERSAVSITSNIAEGFGRQSMLDKKHFYVMARGSAYELQNQLLIARDTNRISEQDFQELSKLSIDSLRLLHGLIRSLTKVKNANS
ncbi:MAG: four helix bundle protein [Candidatus Saccharimonadales bacterium]